MNTSQDLPVGFREVHVAAPSKRVLEMAAEVGASDEAPANLPAGPSIR
jgi:hypothetical protein